ncbi:MAG: L,D-transpeptidase family protein [Lachnospiraceae bacterium]
MKKRTGIILAVLLSCILLPGLIYLGLAIYYQDSFYYGTWINGIYCTGKTVEEVQKELTESFSYEGLRIEGVESEDFLSAEELKLSFDFKPALEEYLNHQNPFNWFYQLVTGHHNQSLLPIIDFSEKNLEQWIYTANFYEKNLQLTEDSLSIVLGPEGYQLEENKADVLRLSAAEEAIREAVYSARDFVSLVESGCYFQREDTADMEEVRRLYAKLEDFQSFSLTYTIKEKRRSLTKAELAKFILRDEKTEEFVFDKEGKLMIRQASITEFVKELAKEYDTWNNWYFTTRDGREVHITKGNYGLQIDQKAEAEYLTRLLKEGSSEPVEHSPKYARDISYKDQHGIGNTYIEIDMGAQKMYYLEEGEVRLETDVVTGCTKKGMGTPQMVCYVYNKKEDAILRGEGYRAPVNFWVPVYGGIGIHDATWRSQFGGEIYIREGSHGCINTPLDKMEELFELIEVGIPVVIYN